MKETKEARWLFNEDVHNYLRTELYNAILSYDSVNQKVYDNSTGQVLLSESELAEATKLKRETLLWIADQPEVLKNKLSEFMKI